MASVLLVDDDPVTIETLLLTLRLAGHDCIGASTGKAALQAVDRFRPDISFLDIELPDMSGLELMSSLRSACPAMACVVMTGYPRFEYARAALRAGAADWLDKPVFVEDLLGALRRALVGRFRNPLDNVCLAAATPHAVTRLADTVLRFIACPEDAPTFRLLGRQVGHAPGCLRNWCRTGDIQPRMFRDFARGLRAVYRIERHGDTVDADLLAIVDGRTLRQFRLKCGGSPSALPRTVATFLDSQQFVRQQVFIEAVRAAVTATDGSSPSPVVFSRREQYFASAEVSMAHDRR